VEFQGHRANSSGGKRKRGEREEREEREERKSHDRRLNAPSRTSQVHSNGNSRDTIPIRLTTATAFSGKREYQVTT